MGFHVFPFVTGTLHTLLKPFCCCQHSCCQCQSFFVSLLFQQNPTPPLSCVCCAIYWEIHEEWWWFLSPQRQPHLPGQVSLKMTGNPKYWKVGKQMSERTNPGAAHSEREAASAYEDPSSQRERRWKDGAQQSSVEVGGHERWASCVGTDMPPHLLCWKVLHHCKWV